MKIVLSNNEIEDIIVAYLNEKGLAVQKDADLRAVIDPSAPDETMPLRQIVSSIELDL